MAVRKIAHPSIDDRKAKGVEARDRAPLSSHTKWRPAADRPDPVALLEEQDTTREPDLVPVRHGRMMVSPFTFYRGAAKIMAADLADTPGGRAGGPAVRGCAPVELRRVRLARAAAAVRFERFRRDAAGAVRVRREADGGELHHRRPQQRLLPGGHARRDAGVGAGLPGGDGRVRPDGHDGHLVRLPGRGRAQGLDPYCGGRDGQAGEGEEAGQAGGQDRRRRRSRRRRRRRRRRSGRRRRPRRRTPATACRRCPSSASWSTGSYRIVSQPPVVVPFRDWTATYGLPADEVEQGDPRAVPRLPGHPAGRPAPPAGALPIRGRGPQGRRRRQRRDPGVHRLAPGTRRAGPAVPAGQGGDRVGAGALPAARAATSSTASGWCRGSG